VRVPASSGAPVRLVVAGVMLSAVAAVDLSTGAVPSGAPAAYYVFAVASPGSTTFTLAINTSPAETAATRLIGQFYWDGSTITNLRTLSRADILAHTGLDMLYPCNGRLTLTSGLAVTAADISAASTLYFSPHLGCCIALYEVGFGWRIYTFSELSISLAGLTASKGYDVFIRAVSGVFTLEVEAWASDTARSVGLVLQDGIQVKSGDPTRRYLGSFYTSGSGTTEDSRTNRLVWNLYNRVWKKLRMYTSSSHTYTLTTWRYWNADSNTKFAFFSGLDLEDLIFTIHARVYGGAEARLAMAIDTDMTPYENVEIGAGNTYRMNIGASYVLSPLLGYHSMAVIESTYTGGDTSNFSLLTAYGSVSC
jgi:hypothetical protein